MRQERFANNASTTLNGALTIGATSVPVTSAAAFPTEGDFRLVINDEIMLVTAVSGNTFTVVRGQESTSATTHANLDAVYQIVTKGGLQNYFAENYPLADQTGKPPLRLQEAGGIVTSSDFSWVNQVSATVTDNAGGSIWLTDTALGSGNHARLLVKTAPTAPYVITAAIIPNLFAAAVGSVNCGPLVRESSTGEFMTCSFVRAIELAVHKYASPTSLSSSPWGRDEWSITGYPIWLRIEDDNTDLNFSVSMDGMNYIELYSEGRTVFMAGGPDQVGFYLNNGYSAEAGGMTLVAWDEA